jgi:hypothetical protein
MAFVIPTTNIQYSESEGAGVGPPRSPILHFMARQNKTYTIDRCLWLEQFPDRNNIPGTGVCVCGFTVHST